MVCRGLVWGIILCVPLILVGIDAANSVVMVYHGVAPYIVRLALALVFSAVGVVFASYMMGPAMREGLLENEREARADPQRYKGRRAREKAWAVLVLIVIFIILIALRWLSK